LNYFILDFYFIVGSRDRLRFGECVWLAVFGLPIHRGYRETHVSSANN